jgi:pseudouridine synthase
VPLEEGLGTLTGLRVAAPGRLRLVLRTGWKRQVRRMCAAVGLRVTRLRRVRMGPLSLGALPLGKWRELTTKEVTVLRAAGPGLARPSRAPLKGTR